ncbi:MAG: hypothetical protein MUE36_06515 [Acidimicrobiales bacterium]|nr:hypothetical protein [Acidimicrobiales bacterium]
MAVPALLVAGLALGACTSSGDDAAPATTLTGPAATIAAAAELLPPIAADQELPPQDLSSIREVYDEALATMGLTLTRGALIDLSGGRYEPSPDGRHLALYVEPIAGRTAEEYAEAAWTLSALVTPDVFARWSGLDSYDICQEPLPEVDPSPEPSPVTQLNLTREAASRVDWTNGDLTSLLVAARQSDDLRMYVNREMRETATYSAANDEARALTGAGPVLTTPPG